MEQYIGAFGRRTLVTAMELVDIPFKITEPAGIARIREPIRIGIPLPRGQVRDLNTFTLRNQAGHKLPLQMRPLAHWSDGSAQWALLDTEVSMAAHESVELHLQREREAVASMALSVNESVSSIEVDTGAAVFTIPRKGAALISSVRRMGSEQLTSDGLRIQFRNGRGAERHAQIHSTRVDENGPLRVTLVVEGSIEGTDRRRPLAFLARLVLFADSGAVEIEFRIRNPRRARHRGGLWDLGDKGSQLIRELALVLRTANAPKTLRWRAAPDCAVQETHDASRWAIYQDSSGGENWNSPNHLGADNQITVKFRGYQVRGARGLVLESGSRSTPSVELISDSGCIAGGVEGFWQNFPKALRVIHGELQIALFPAETRSPTELQGGEQKKHRLWLFFGPEADGMDSLARRQQPLQATLHPVTIEESGAIHGFAAPRKDDDPRYVAYMRTIIEGQYSFFVGREAIDEYGWRNFGDVYADHEAVHHKGQEPFVSHYNNQYDVILGTLLQGLRSGDTRWHNLARDLARHVADIDIYHTEDDKPAYNGGLFWHSDHYLPAGLATHRTYSKSNGKSGYGGGPDNEHNYTSGLLLYHYLSGDAEAAEAVISLANFVITMDDGSRTIFRFLDNGPTGNASKTVSMDFHGPGRGAGNSVNALIDGFLLTRARHYLSKADDLIQRCIHPRDDISDLHLDNPEIRWSYLVFLQAMGKYLELKREIGELDQMYCYARDSLLLYATWMLENERPYKEQLDKVLLPTETWPAQDIRKARVLANAAEYCVDELSRRRMKDNATFYETRALSDLLAFPSACLVRPRVLLAVYGSKRDGDANDATKGGVVSTTLSAELPKKFIGQKQRTLNRLVRRWIGKSST